MLFINGAADPKDPPANVAGAARAYPNSLALTVPNQAHDYHVAPTCRVLDETRTTQRRLPDLPSRAGVRLVLAVGLSPRQGYERVWDKLVASLEGLGLPRPSGKPPRDLGRRPGAAPFQVLSEALANRSWLGKLKAPPGPPAIPRQS
jgi:hypothetical protein